MRLGQLNLKVIFQNKHPLFKTAKSKESSKQTSGENHIECSFITNIQEKSQQDNDPKRFFQHLIKSQIVSRKRLLSFSSNRQTLFDRTTTARPEHLEAKLLHKNAEASAMANQENKSHVVLNSQSGCFNYLPIERGGETDLLTISSVASEENFWVGKVASATGSAITITSIASNHEVPFNTPIVIDETLTRVAEGNGDSTLKLLHSACKQLIKYLGANQESGTESVDVATNLQQPKLSTDVEFGGVKKNLKNTTSGRSIDCALKSTNALEGERESTGIMTLQTIYATPPSKQETVREVSASACTYEDLLSIRYSPSPSAEVTKLTYAIVENDVKNMIKDLLKETASLKDEIVITVDCETKTENCLNDSKRKIAKETLDEIINSLPNESEQGKLLQIEEDVKSIIDEVLNNLKDAEVKTVVLHENIKNSVRNIGDSSEVANKPKDVCSQSIFYCNTNVFEHPRAPSRPKIRKTYPATVSVKKRSPSRKCIINSDDDFLTILEKSNNMLALLYNDLFGSATFAYSLLTASYSSSQNLNQTHSTTGNENQTFDSDNDTCSAKNKQKPNKIISTGSNMQKSSKFFNIKTSMASTQQQPTSSTSDDNSEAILNETVIRSVDLVDNNDADVEKEKKEKASTSKVEARRSKLN